MNCFRILLYIFNLVFILFGIVLVSIGIWSAVSKIYVSLVIGDKLFTATAYLIIAIGIVIVLVCIVGIIALRKDSRKWFITYLSMLIFCFVVLIIAAVLAVVFKGDVENLMVSNMRNSLINGYGKDKDITAAWDQLQSELRCCAVSETVLSQTVQYNYAYVDNTVPTADEKDKQDSWAIYKRTEFYRKQISTDSHNRKYVPSSCCVYDDKLHDYNDLKFCQYFPNGPPVNYASNHKNDNLYYAGCYEKGKEFVLNQSDIIVAIGFVFAFLMIAGMVLTFLLMLSSARNDETKRRRQPNSVI